MKRKTSHNNLVTVYITNYNYENYIKQAIESVLCQTYKNYELIIIDDGSTDDSIEVINNYITHPKIRVIYQKKNKGLLACNNLAIKASKGEFIIRLDADDYFDKNALLVLVNTIKEEDNIGMVFPDYYYVGKTGNIEGQERRNNFDKVNLLDQPAHGACTLIRKDFLVEVGGYNSNFDRQDGWDVWLKFIDSYKIKNVNLPLFYYRKHEGNLTNNSNKLLEARSKIYKHHANNSNKKKLKVTAVLSVRGRIISNSSQELGLLGGKPVIAWTIDEVLKSKIIQELIIATPDPDIINYVNKIYKKRVNIVKRDIQGALENTSHEESLRLSLKKRKIKTFDALLELTPDYPMRNSFYIEKAINVMRVHDVDKVIGVIPEESIIYKHDGSSLISLDNNHNQKKLRLERDYFYRQTGGISLTKSKLLKEKKASTNKAIQGHIILSKEAATAISTDLDLKIANTILKASK